MDCRTPGFLVHDQLPKLAQTHVHWANDDQIIYTDSFKLQRCSKQSVVNITSCPQGFSTFSWPMSSYRWGIKGGVWKQVVLPNSLSSVSWGGESRPSRGMLPRIPDVHGQLLVAGTALSVHSVQSHDFRAEWDRTLQTHTHARTHTYRHKVSWGACLVQDG